MCVFVCVYVCACVCTHHTPHSESRSAHLCVCGVCGVQARAKKKKKTSPPCTTTTPKPLPASVTMRTVASATLVALLCVASTSVASATWFNKTAVSERAQGGHRYTVTGGCWFKSGEAVRTSPLAAFRCAAHHVCGWCRGAAGNGGCATQRGLCSTPPTLRDSSSPRSSTPRWPPKTPKPSPPSSAKFSPSWRPKSRPSTWSPHT